MAGQVAGGLAPQPPKTGKRPLLSQKSRKSKKGTTNPKKSPKIKKRIYAVIQKEFTVLTSCRNYGNMLS
jgi:hypothetical protein